MHAMLRRSEWSEVKIHYEHGRSPVTYVYRRDSASDQWEPWVVIAQSAILKRLGITGWGLYAARPFKRNDYVGKMGGTLVGHYATREAAMSAPEARRLLRRGHDKLITVRPSQGPGFDLIDGQGAGPPHIEMANDPRGTRLEPNTELSEYGWLSVTRGRVPAFSLAKTVEGNVDAELRWSYQESYWNLHELMGTDAAHAIEVD